MLEEMTCIATGAAQLAHQKEQMVAMREDGEWKAMWAMPSANHKMEQELKALLKDLHRRIECGGEATPYPILTILSHILRT